MAVTEARMRALLNAGLSQQAAAAIIAEVDTGGAVTPGEGGHLPAGISGFLYNGYPAIGGQWPDEGPGAVISFDPKQTLLLAVVGDDGTPLSTIDVAGANIYAFAGLVIVRGNQSVELDSPIIKLLQLPTADPHIDDQVWNDAGTLKISAGV
jgi:hypothetical protein